MKHCFVLNEMDIASLATLRLQDSTGKPHPLDDVWADRAIVLVFLRHFG
jgi:hypothetical protein